MLCFHNCALQTLAMSSTKKQGINLGLFVMFLLIKIENYYMCGNLTWHFSLSLSPSPDPSNYNGYQNSMRETSPFTTRRQQTARRLPKPRLHAQSTKDSQEYKLLAVRKTRARGLRANKQLKDKNWDPKKMLGKSRATVTSERKKTNWRNKGPQLHGDTKVKVAHGYNDGFQRQSFCNLLYKN